MRSLSLALTLLLSAAQVSAWAKAPSPPENGSLPALTAQEEASVDDARLEAAKVHGPATVGIGAHATWSLPAGIEFLPSPSARALAKTMGEAGEENLQGLMVKSESGWPLLMAQVWAFDSGHVDADFAALDSKAVLAVLRQHLAKGESLPWVPSEEASEVDVSWGLPPRYDATTHVLEWSLMMTEKGASDEVHEVYSAAVLGRSGYVLVSVMVMPTDETRERARAAMQDIMKGLTFRPTQQYQDFDAAHDAKAGIGLPALITGPTGKARGHK